jgi:delta8-fatty-acid desaturase
MSVTAFNNAIEKLYSQHKKGLKKQDAAQKHLDTLEIRYAYWQLKQEVTERGLFKCNYWNYAKDVCRFTVMIYLSMWFTFNGTDTWHYMLGATFLSVFWHQLVFPAHNAGHNEITGNSNIDNAIGVLIANFIGGLSIGWWKDNHNVHHIATNHLEHDPDIQHLPFLAITTKLFTNIFSTYYKRVLPFDAVSKFFVRRQHYLYYLVLSFGRFNLHRLSFIYLFTTPNIRTRKLDLIGITFFFIWFGKLLSMLPNWKIRSAYVMISYMLTFPLHVQITLAHFGMSTEDMGPSEPFSAKMIRTIMDIETPECVD